MDICCARVDQHKRGANEKTIIVSAQTTCNGGLGRVVYERLPDQQLQGFDDDVVRSLRFRKYFTFNS